MKSREIPDNDPYPNDLDEYRSRSQMRKLSKHDYRMLRVWKRGKELAKHE